MAKSGSQISNVLRITDVNDFLAPSTACVLPLEGGAQPSSNGNVDVIKLESAPAGSVLAPIVPTQTPISGVAKAKVTISDCLACSGCVTSAETVLLSNASLETFRSFIQLGEEQKSKAFSVVALSQQSVASIAVHFGLQLTETARKLTTYLKEVCHIDIVLDLSLPRHLSLIEASKEFIERFRSGKQLTITSSCPGWLTYAEKTQGDIVLDCVSSVRSPQGMLASIAPYFRPPGENRPTWVCTIMPCHDKKLEASRPEFVRQEDQEQASKDIDCVLTTGELLELLEENQFDLSSAAETCLNSKYSPSGTGEFGVNVGSSSGGYAEFILKAASKELLGVDLPVGKIITKKASRSGDLHTATISNNEGKTLTFATAYGFRCLQTILRKVRQGQCMYNYIELMACPGGCTNGGGQISLPENADGDLRSWKHQADSHLKRVNDVFHAAPTVPNPLTISVVPELYQRLFPDGDESSARQPLMVQIQSRKTDGLASISW